VCTIDPPEIGLGAAAGDGGKSRRRKTQVLNIAEILGHKAAGSFPGRIEAPGDAYRPAALHRPVAKASPRRRAIIDKVHRRYLGGYGKPVKFTADKANVQSIGSCNVMWAIEPLRYAFGAGIDETWIHQNMVRISKWLHKQYDEISTERLDMTIKGPLLKDASGKVLKNTDGTPRRGRPGWYNERAVYEFFRALGAELTTVKPDQVKNVQLIELQNWVDQGYSVKIAVQPPDLKAQNMAHGASAANKGMITLVKLPKKRP